MVSEEKIIEHRDKKLHVSGIEAPTKKEGFNAMVVQHFNDKEKLLEFYKNEDRSSKQIRQVKVVVVQKAKILGHAFLLVTNNSETEAVYHLRIKDNKYKIEKVYTDKKELAKYTEAAKSSNTVIDLRQFFISLRQLDILAFYCTPRYYAELFQDCVTFVQVFAENLCNLEESNQDKIAQIKKLQVTDFDSRSFTPIKFVWHHFVHYLPDWRFWSVLLIVVCLYLYKR